MGRGNKDILQAGRSGAHLGTDARGNESGLYLRDRIGKPPVDERVQARAQLRHALHFGDSIECGACRADVARLDLEHRCIDPLHQLLRRPVGHQNPAVEDRQGMAALGLVHVMSRHQYRGAVVNEPKEAFPEITPALRIHPARWLVEEEQLRLVQRRGS